jgi:hypothetical protein
MPTTWPGFDHAVRSIALCKPDRMSDIELPLPKKTDNYRTKYNRWVGEYRDTVSQILTAMGTMLPDPPFIFLYRVSQVKKDRGGRYADPHNYQKTVVDAVLRDVDDRLVCPWCLPGIFDAKQSGIEVWFIGLSKGA